MSPDLLSTARLELRRLNLNDAPAMFALFSDPAVMRYWSFAPWTEMAQAEACIRQALADYDSASAMRMGIVLKSSGELIGNCSLYNFHLQNRRCDTGYLLAQAHWGQGYLHEAMTALIDYAFNTLALIRIEADIDPRNTASARALQKLGFRHEGHMRERWIVNGEVCDTDFYGLLRREWQPGPFVPR
ncbi:GNAT family N-acetyltransferase [Massilia sp. TS11]|uniref:GNAT family N-acetyltransferase n=1 Tax=Massilia sp. TS11 TaxID=2908003 RepID=UPI001EDA941E|nr:GNAT family protein [Massilia sp. TS11]MCG2586054.1 GNAT family N-acetyltransferase [Massilia sp. TS11]